MRIFTCCVAVLHAIRMQISVLFIDSILLLQGQTSGQQEFAGGQDHWIEADLHGEQGRTAGVYWSTQ